MKTLMTFANSQNEADDRGGAIHANDIAKLIEALAALPGPNAIEVRDTEELPERDQL